MPEKALLACTGAYKTASTHALQVLAGLLSLDLEVRRAAMRCDLKNGTINMETFCSMDSELLDIWQYRWTRSTKGRWTLGFFPDVRQRYYLPLVMDHYTSQIITGHGDFYSKLSGFKLVENPMCSCEGGVETAEHLLVDCNRTVLQRGSLERILMEGGEVWPPAPGVFLKKRTYYDALKKFSAKLLTSRSDR